MELRQTNASSPNITKYLADYKKRYIAFAAVAAYVENTCRSILNSNGILANVASRTKDINRLEDKLHKRKDGDDFDSIDYIEKEINDLIGVRITVYFPNQVEEVCAMFESLFSDGTMNINNRENKPLSANELLEKITHDKSIKTLDTSPTYLRGQNNMYNAQYGSYRAIHVQFTLKKHDLGTVLSGLLGDRRLKVEIQIQSSFMHSWSDVEHELCYKSLTGRPSTEEHQLLDCLNGIEKLGEHVLIQLKRSLDLRLMNSTDKFSSPFELAEYIRRHVEGKQGSSRSPRSYVLGNVDEFFDFLVYTRKDNHKTIQREMNKLKIDYDTNRPIISSLLINMVGKIQFDEKHPFLLDHQNAKIEGACADNIVELLATISDMACRPIMHASPIEVSSSAVFDPPTPYMKMRQELSLYDDATPVLPGAAYPVKRSAMGNAEALDEIQKLVKCFDDNGEIPLIQHHLRMAQIKAWKKYVTRDFTKSSAQMSCDRSKL